MRKKCGLWSGLAAFQQLQSTPKGWDMNNTVQAEGAVRRLCEKERCVPAGTRQEDKRLQHPASSTPKGWDMNNTVQAEGAVR